MNAADRTCSVDVEADDHFFRRLPHRTAAAGDGGADSTTAATLEYEPYLNKMEFI